MFTVYPIQNKKNMYEHLLELS